MSTVEVPPSTHSLVGQGLLEHLDVLYRYAFVLTHSRLEAENLVQETCLRALRAEATLQANSNLKSWLFTILRNYFLSQIRQRYRRQNVLEIDAKEYRETLWQQSYEDNPETLFLQMREREQTQAALARLPEPYRDVLILREWESLGYKEIAEILGCPVGTVMSRLGRAREKLKNALESKHAGG